VDHGPSYENSQLTFICGSIGAVLLHAPVRDCASKAKVERTFGSLMVRWLNGLDTDQIRSLDEFNGELAEAVRQHNLMSLCWRIRVVQTDPCRLQPYSAHF
jgi:hypothetical protein